MIFKTIKYDEKIISIIKILIILLCFFKIAPTYVDNIKAQNIEYSISIERYKKNIADLKKRKKEEEANYEAEYNDWLDKFPRVFITATGKCYHTKTCYHASYVNETINLFEAVNADIRLNGKKVGYLPCSKCKPVKIDSNLMKNKPEKSSKLMMSASYPDDKRKWYYSYTILGFCSILAIIFIITNLSTIIKHR